MEELNQNKEGVGNKIEAEKRKLQENIMTVTPMIDRISKGLLKLSGLSGLALTVSTTAITHLKNQATKEYANIVLPQFEALKQLAQEKDMYDPNSVSNKVYETLRENMTDQTEQTLQQINHYQDLLQINFQVGAPIVAGTLTAYLVVQLYQFLQKHGQSKL